MWAKLAGFLLLGYLVMTRSFAYLGLPQYHVFIGEVALAAFLLFKPDAWLRYWPRALFVRGPLSGVAWAFLAFFLHGLFQILRALYHDFPLLPALQEFAFNYYPLYLFLGLWVGICRPRFLRRIIKWVAWCNGLYGVAYVLFLNRVSASLPGVAGAKPVPVFGQPGGSALAIIGLLLLAQHASAIWLPLLLNVFVMLGVAVRGEWLAFGVGLVVWAWFGKRLNRALLGATAVALVLCVGYFTRFSMPAPVTRGGTISALGIIGRAVAPVDIRAAEELTPQARWFAGTARWRLAWWQAVWRSVHRDTPSALFGHGYGFPLFSLAPGNRDRSLRTPHSAFFYALGYGGWVGVIVFFAFQLSLRARLARACRLTRNPFGLVVWSMVITGALSGNVLESPYGAIPFYLLMGLSIVPAAALTARAVGDAAFLRTAPSGQPRPLAPTSVSVRGLTGYNRVL